MILTRNMLTPNQSDILKRAFDMIMQGQREIFIGGAAGSGKTACAKFLMEDCINAGKTIHAAGPTNKSVSVLRDKLGGIDVKVQTLHRLLNMKPVETNIEEREKLARDLEDAYKHNDALAAGIKRKLDRLNAQSLQFNKGSELTIKAGDIVFVDEASMVSEAIKNQLLEENVNVIYIGDPYQLAPVEGATWFNVPKDMEFNIIHRQAQGSGILDLATTIRTGAEKGETITSIINSTRQNNPPDIRFINAQSLIDNKTPCKVAFTNIAKNHDQSIVFRRNDPKNGGYSMWKVSSLNAIMRWSMDKLSPYPMAGEEIVLTHPFYMADEQWFTGDRIKFVNDATTLQAKEKLQIGMVESKGDMVKGSPTAALRAGAFAASLEHEDHGYYDNIAVAPLMCENMPMQLAYTILNARPAATNPLTCTLRAEYGYVMTGHTAQGSQWDRVCVFVEPGLLDMISKRGGAGNAHKWLYTAVSRAAKYLTLVII